MARMRLDTSRVRIQHLRTQRAPAAVVKALNAGIRAGKAAMIPAIAQDLQLRPDESWVHVQDATALRQTAALFASAKRIPLIKFGATGPEPSRGKGSGVTARTRRGRYPRAFIATMRSGHRGVFERKTTRRLPIREKFGPSIAHVFTKKVAIGMAAAQAEVVRVLSAEFRLRTE